MNNIIFIELPFPPSVNAIYKPTNKKIYATKELKEYKKKVKSIVQAHMRKNSLCKITVPVKMECVLYEPNKRIRDLNNLKKSLLDALTFSKLWEDDNLSREEHFYLERSDELKGKVFLRISPK